MCMDDLRRIPLLQDSKLWVKNVGARAHLQQWLLRPEVWRSYDPYEQFTYRGHIDRGDSPS